MVMTILWLLAFRASYTHKHTRFAIFISIVGLGVLIEILQSLLPIARDFEIFDIIANIFGSALGLILFITLIKQ
jgi:VanZ family protein